MDKNPFTVTYKSMRDLMKEEQDAGGDALNLRVRIVDPYEYEKANLPLQVIPL